VLNGLRQELIFGKKGPEITVFNYRKCQKELAELRAIRQITL